jgi:hypothetical protein
MSLEPSSNSNLNPHSAPSDSSSKPSSESSTVPSFIRRRFYGYNYDKYLRPPSPVVCPSPFQCTCFDLSPDSNLYVQEMTLQPVQNTGKFRQISSNNRSVRKGVEADCRTFGHEPIKKASDSIEISYIRIPKSDLCVSSSSSEPPHHQSETLINSSKTVIGLNSNSMESANIVSKSNETSTTFHQLTLDTRSSSSSENSTPLRSAPSTPSSSTSVSSPSSPLSTISSPSSSCSSHSVVVLPSARAKPSTDSDNLGPTFGKDDQFASIKRTSLSSSPSSSAFSPSSSSSSCTSFTSTPSSSMQSFNTIDQLNSARNLYNQIIVLNARHNYIIDTLPRLIKSLGEDYMTQEVTPILTLSDKDFAIAKQKFANLTKAVIDQYNCEEISDPSHISELKGLIPSAITDFYDVQTIMTSFAAYINSLADVLKRLEIESGSSSTASLPPPAYSSSSSASSVVIATSYPSFSVDISTSELEKIIEVVHARVTPTNDWAERDDEFVRVYKSLKEIGVLPPGTPQSVLEKKVLFFLVVLRVVTLRLLGRDVRIFKSVYQVWNEAAKSVPAFSFSHDSDNLSTASVAPLAETDLILKLYESTNAEVDVEHMEFESISNLVVSRMKVTRGFINTRVSEVKVNHWKSTLREEWETDHNFQGNSILISSNSSATSSFSSSVSVLEPSAPAISAPAPSSTPPFYTSHYSLSTTAAAELYTSYVDAKKNMDSRPFLRSIVTGVLRGFEKDVSDSSKLQQLMAELEQHRLLVSAKRHSNSQSSIRSPQSATSSSRFTSADTTHMNPSSFRSSRFPDPILTGALWQVYSKFRNEDRSQLEDEVRDCLLEHGYYAADDLVTTGERSGCFKEVMEDLESHWTSRLPSSKRKRKRRSSLAAPHRVKKKKAPASASVIASVSSSPPSSSSSSALASISSSSPPLSSAARRSTRYRAHKLSQAELLKHGFEKSVLLAEEVVKFQGDYFRNSTLNAEEYNTKMIELLSKPVAKTEKDEKDEKDEVVATTEKDEKDEVVATTEKDEIDEMDENLNEDEVQILHATIQNADESNSGSSCLCGGDAKALQWALIKGSLQAAIQSCQMTRKQAVACAKKMYLPAVWNAHRIELGDWLNDDNSDDNTDSD